MGQRKIDKQHRELEQVMEWQMRELNRAFEKVEQTYDETLRTLGQLLDLRDNETAGHSERVKKYALKLAQAMECTPGELKDITRGAYLHDIGKIGVPDSVLLKPGALTAEEKVLMDTHVRIGYDLISGISFLAASAEIVLTHHERFDGTGYPQGLSGDAIPLGSRIFAVADTLDAMTSDRFYRKAVSFSVAKEEIVRESGRQFDPAVVQAFVGIPEETWETLLADSYSENPPAAELRDPAPSACELVGSDSCP
jgi:putative nucleotidyltransferase with HDIG domain